MPSIAAPPSDGKGESFPDYATEVELRRKVVLPVGPVAGEVCPAMGSCKLMEPDGVARAIQVLHENPAPDALDAVYQDVARLSHFKRTTQPIDECLV